MPHVPVRARQAELAASLIEWNQRGPAGSRAQGESPGQRLRQEARDTKLSTQWGQSSSAPVQNAVAYCPPGKVVLGGGVTGVPGSVGITESAPDGFADGSGGLFFNPFEGRASVETGESSAIQVVAICADLNGPAGYTFDPWPG